MHYRTATTRRNSRLRADERGVVSFLVAMIMMAVISLIVIGFAQVARRNQQESVDRQLSTAAYYAAESGINDTKTIIKSGGSTIAAQSSCGSGTSTYPPVSLTPDNTVGYTCVLVDPAPPSLVYNGISQDSSTVASIETATNLTALNFTWSKQDGMATSTCSGIAHYNLRQADSWNCAVGILRVDLVQADPGTAITSSDQLAGKTITFYLSPNGDHSGTVNGLSGAVPFGGSNPNAYYGQGCRTADNATCTASFVYCSNNCLVTIPLSGSKKYFARITSLYRSAASLVITGKEGGVPAKFINSQVSVDVTGKAQDVLRRVQVRLQAAGSTGSSASQIPINALTSSNTICKRFAIMPGDTAGNPSSLCAGP